MDIRSTGRKITPAQQLNNLVTRYDNVTGRMGRGSFSCYIPVRPTALSEEYVLRIHFELNPLWKIVVYVHSPKPLKLAKGETKLPHVYDSKAQILCLFRSSKDEWNPSMLLSESVVHWAVEWLYFYEIWLCTGRWLGGGEHPPRKDC